eukprot:TRINITY_DN480_c0_g1_i1.p1 TRINITY_DN480_c0_g1~~TRINITY_DN480_c0_g1_i1.p1  ORF type:complete len:103 (-),score=37.22 TRINITY_DN480_c0_g1_i1:73-381(-)
MKSIVFVFAILALLFSFVSANDQKVRDVEFEQLAEELAATPEGSPSNDGDDDLEAWEIGLIVTTCFFFVLLLLLIVAFLVLGSGGKDKYNVNVHRTENVESI